MRTAPKTSMTARRQAFTLVEMLVVIAIIVVIISLTAAGIFYWIGSQQRRNSEQTLREVKKVLSQQWAYVHEEAKKETPSPSILALAGNDNARAKALWIKARLVEAFPMSFAEINNCPMYANIPGIGAPAIPPNMRKNNASYQKALKNYIPPINPQPETTEMGACLLIALTTVSRGGDKLTADSLGRAAIDTDGDNILEVADGYAAAIGFYRFAWNDPLLAATNPAAQGSTQAKNADPQDPEGTLLSPGWYTNAAPNYRQITENYFMFQISPNNGQSANYIVPVLVSGGGDKRIGLNADLSVNNGAYVTDNIYSYKLR